VDPVSQLLAERERRHPRLAPWVAAAVLLHAGLASAMWLVSRNGSHPPAQLPTVAVRFVQPEPVRRRSEPPGGGPQRRATPAPKPTAAPTAVPTAPPEPEPEPERELAPEPEVAATAPQVDRPSEDAMAELGSKATPQPTPEPEPAPSGSGGGSGLSLGGGGDASEAATGVPSDFQFSYYLQRMLALIESRWYKPPVPPGTRARVRYTIQSSGRLEAIQLEESSGVPAFDRAALRALYAANPLPPLPPAYRKPSVTVHLTFSE